MFIYRNIIYITVKLQRQMKYGIDIFTLFSSRPIQSRWNFAIDGCIADRVNEKHRIFLRLGKSCLFLLLVGAAFSSGLSIRSGTLHTDMHNGTRMYAQTEEHAPLFVCVCRPILKYFPLYLILREQTRHARYKYVEMRRFHSRLILPGNSMRGVESKDEARDEFTAHGEYRIPSG